MLLRCIHWPRSKQSFIKEGWSWSVHHKHPGTPSTVHLQSGNDLQRHFCANGWGSCTSLAAMLASLLNLCPPFFNSWWLCSTVPTTLHLQIGPSNSSLKQFINFNSGNRPKVFKIARNQNHTAHLLAKQARISTNSNTYNQVMHAQIKIM